VEVAVRELPRDPEIVSLYKKMAEHGPLPTVHSTAMDSSAAYMS